MLEKRWKPTEIEPKWEKFWHDVGIHRFDENDGDRPIYSIDTPPPFTSGDLHMGHVLSYTFFDFVARYKRMKGYNVYYPQGWDCQGFPTEVRVERKFGRNLPPDEFIGHCIKWTERFIERMKKQMIRMGYSPDWRYEYRTMSDDYHKRVQYSLLKMYEDGLVYNAEHPVFWCPNCTSAIAKAELEDVERKTYLNYLKFNTEADPKGYIEIATTRPELLHACVAIFVNPSDERYRHLQGKEAEVPIFGQKVKILTDPEVDPEFGTGIVMMCTFGDKQDVVWTYRHGLPLVRSLDRGGKLLNAGDFTGLTVGKAKERVIRKLKEEGFLLRQEELTQMVKVHDRCRTAVELILSNQWFIRLKGYEEAVKKAGMSMRWVPEFTIQYFLDWTDYIEWDWVISRNRMFGTPIPFWRCEKCGHVITPSYDSLPVDPRRDPPPQGKCPECGGRVVGEKAVCDCWVDSSITPLIISGWPYDEERFKKLYPSDLRPQGVEIIRTWAFYTIFRCLMLTGKPPFKELLLNGSVLAPDGKKMSKSLGNVIPPDKLIEEYSADAVRQWAALSGARAKDRPFSYKDIRFARSFANKLWNASRLVERALEDYDPRSLKEDRLKLRAVDRWILSRMNRLIKSTTELFEEFDFFAIITQFHDFFWHEFCDFYLEEVKHRIYQPDKYGENSKLAAQYVLYNVLLNSIKLFAPIAPHITEEIYQQIFKESEGLVSIHKDSWPQVNEGLIDEESEKKGELLKSILSEIRKFRSGNRMSMKDEITKVKVSVDDKKVIEEIREEIIAVGKVRTVEISEGAFRVEVEK